MISLDLAGRSKSQVVNKNKRVSTRWAEARDILYRRQIAARARAFYPWFSTRIVVFRTQISILWAQGSDWAPIDEYREKWRRMEDDTGLGQGLAEQLVEGS